VRPILKRGDLCSSSATRTPLREMMMLWRRLEISYGTLAIFFLLVSGPDEVYEALQGYLRDPGAKGLGGVAVRLANVYLDNPSDALEETYSFTPGDSSIGLIGIACDYELHLE